MQALADSVPTKYAVPPKTRKHEPPFWMSTKKVITLWSFGKNSLLIPFKTLICTVKHWLICSNVWREGQGQDKRVKIMHKASQMLLFFNLLLTIQIA